MLQKACGGSGKPVLRVVSLNADNTNRGHAFDMDIDDLEKEGKPLPYQEARKFFRTDPSQRCPPSPSMPTPCTVISKHQVSDAIV